MRRGVEPVEMLIDGWLPRRATVWMSSEPEAGKTWICLWLVARAVQSGLRVAYIDAELGEPEIVRRLVLLGCDPDAVDRGVDYLPFPSWSLDDAAGWDEACAENAWDLVVFETASDFLSDAGLNENDGRDVTEWAKSFPERVRVHGGTALVSDHVRKDGITNGYAVGSRAKKAKTQLGYEVRVVSGYDTDRVGAVEIVRTKNTFSAPVARKRTLSIGPLDGAETFDIRDSTSRAAAREQEPVIVMADVLCAALYDGGHINQHSAISQNTLVSLVSGNRLLKTEAAQLAASSPAWPVHSYAHGANSLRYYATGRERTVELTGDSEEASDSGTAGTDSAGSGAVAGPTSAGATIKEVIPGDSGITSESLGTSSEQPVPGRTTTSGTGIDSAVPAGADR
jgi:hypothetical protein